MATTFRKITRNIHSFVQPNFSAKLNDSDFEYLEEELDFNISASEIKRKGNAAVKKRLSILKLITSQNTPTFDNVVKPLALGANVFRATTLPLIFLQSVSTNADVRRASASVTKSVNACEATILGNMLLYKAVQIIRNDKDEMEKLCNEDKMLIDTLVLDMQRNGAALSGKDAIRFRKYSRRAARKREEFYINTQHNGIDLDFTYEEKLIIVSERLLGGLSDDYDFSRPASTTVLTNPKLILEWVDNKDIRKMAFTKLNSGCAKNIKILKEYSTWNHKMVAVLGNKSFAEYTLEAQVARTTESAFKFLNDLKSKLQCKANEELDKLVKLKYQDVESSQNGFSGFFAWDRQYYINRAIYKKVGIDRSIIKEYFPLDHVLAELLHMYENILGLKIVKVVDADTWSPDVEKYKVYDALNEDILGYFYIDLLNREGKYTNAAMMPICEGFEQRNGMQVHPICALSTSFTPSHTKSQALLQLNEVRTLVQELGHVFHFICTRTKWSMLGSVNVKPDAINIPSQLMECWLTQPETMHKLSSHHQTGLPLPHKLLKDVYTIQNEFQALRYMEQIFHSLFDLTINSSTEGKPNIEGIYKQLCKEVGFLDEGKVDICPPATFDHYDGRYCSKYYGYLWARVIAADIFVSRFLKDGIVNIQAGIEYRKAVLEPGASHDAMAITEKFLGRKPSSEAFFQLNRLA